MRRTDDVSLWPWPLTLEVTTIVGHMCLATFSEYQVQISCDLVTMLSQDVCLFVRLSVTCWYSIVLVARPRRCLTLSNPVTWQNWMAANLGYTADEDTVSWLTNYGKWHAYEKKKNSIETVIHVLKLFSPLDSHTIQAFTWCHFHWPWV